MQFVYKLTVLILLSAVLAVSLAGQVLPQPAQSSQPAGCHHGSETPAPQPANYTCCQAGHNSAILQSAHADDMTLWEIVQQNIPTPTVRAVHGTDRREELNLTYHPPGGLPLLI